MVCVPHGHLKGKPTFYTRKITRGVLFKSTPSTQNSSTQKIAPLTHKEVP